MKRNECSNKYEESLKISQGCQIVSCYGQYSFEYNIRNWITHWNVYKMTQNMKFTISEY